MYEDTDITVPCDNGKDPHDPHRYIAGADLWECPGLTTADIRYPHVRDHYRTADNVPITEGMACWDYDLARVRVQIADTYADPEHDHHRYWDGWFTVVTSTGGRKIMNGERLVTRHPSTGERATV